MTTKRRHHYVPRFYLQAFGSSKRQIHIYNLSSASAVRNASLRDQCRKARFYGRTNDIEDLLGGLEDRVAPILGRIRTSLSPPPRRSTPYVYLLAFLAAQMLRTEVAATRIDAHGDKLFKEVYRDYARSQGFDIDAVRLVCSDPARFSLSYLGPLLFALNDLRLHVIGANEDHQFITSDNPVFKYNYYCEGIKETGVTGALSRGLLIFLPISPARLLLLYDGAIYKVGDLRGDVTERIPEEDIEVLNSMQVIGAKDNIYFADWSYACRLAPLVGTHSRMRDRDLFRVEEFPEDGREGSSLIVSYERMPDLKLRLSFLKIRRAARRVPLHERAMQSRKEMPFEPREDAFDGDHRTRVFRRV